MAILAMKKLRLMIVRSQKEELLKELAKFGCVEFSELTGLIAGSEIEELVDRESSDMLSCRTDFSVLNHAVELLAEYVPGHVKLLSAKPELDCAEFLNNAGVEEAVMHARKIKHADDCIRRADTEESRQRSFLEALQPWLEADIPLDLEETATCSVLKGSIPKRKPIKKMISELEAVSEKAELIHISCDKSQNYVVVLCLKEDRQRIQECLRDAGFASSVLNGTSGTARENRELCEAELKRLEAEKQERKKEIEYESSFCEKIKIAADKLRTRIAVCEAEERLYGTESVVLMEGWFPTDNELQLLALLDRYECAWDTIDPETEEYPTVPVKLENGRFSNGLNMVTNMYSLPAYGTVDPNPLMAPFFILFYGLMISDMGYGLLMIAAALAALKRIKPRGGSLCFCQLLLYGGISTFICGALTGGFFGNALQVIGQILEKPEGWGVLPALINPTEDIIFVLVGAMALGIIHLNIGMVINAVKLLRRGQLADVVWGEGALWITLAGIILHVLKIGTVAGVPVVLVTGILMTLYGGTRGAKGLGKVAGLFGTVYNVATGWLGDILSYVRIMALMLAGSVIAQVFNTIGGMTKSFLLFIPVFIIGHALNFALNLLGCYVHDLRLQCLEFFGKFYEGGGKAFEPLSVKSEYYNPTEQ